MSTVALHEAASEDWVRVNAPMTSLVGTPAMTVGNLLWLDDGKRYLVGHVNWHFSPGAHCTFPALPIVRAWRRLLDVAAEASLGGDRWATAFEIDEDLLELLDVGEIESAVNIAPPTNTVMELDLSGVLKPGMLVTVEGGPVVLVGHVNPLAGWCDWREDHGQRVSSYRQVVPDGLFRSRRYDP